MYYMLLSSKWSLINKYVIFNLLRVLYTTYLEERVGIEVLPRRLH